MNILFLGTAAAEGIPAPFCECDVCQRARRFGGRDVRRRTAALVNNDLLIDFGPDIVASAQQFGISLRDVQTLLVTHAHMDHWYPENLILRTATFRSTPVPPLRLFGPEIVTRFLTEDSTWSRRASAASISVETVAPGQRWQSGAYRIVALPATHAGSDGALLYVIEREGKKLLYATDTGPLSEQAWSIVAREAPFDAVLMDETMGVWETWGEHQSLLTFSGDHQRFVDEGWLQKGAQFVAFHFSHQSNPSHEELVRRFEPHGVIVAYDGLTLRV